RSSALPLSDFRKIRTTLSTRCRVIFEYRPPLFRLDSEAASLNNSTNREPIPFKTPRIRSSNALRFLEKVSQPIYKPVAMEIGEPPGRTDFREVVLPTS